MPFRPSGRTQACYGRRVARGQRRAPPLDDGSSRHPSQSIALLFTASREGRAERAQAASKAASNSARHAGIMEAIGPPPATGDGLLFVMNSNQRQEALRSYIAGAAMQRLATVKAATAGQPIFIFDSDSRELLGPYAAEGPGATNLDSQGGDGRSNFSPRLPAQLRFSPVVRAFAPLPEAVIADIINFDSGADNQGRRRPSHTVEATAVAQLLYIFVLRHHGLYETDEAAPMGTEAPSSAAFDEQRTRAETTAALAAEARAVRERRSEQQGKGGGGGGGGGKGRRRG